MRGILLSFIMFSTRLSIFTSILSYILLGNYITAEKVFVLTSFYNILRQTMTVFFPQGISQIAEACVSIKRLNEFLLFNETKRQQLKLETPGKFHDTNSSNEIGNEESVICLTNATAKWSDSSIGNTLTNINLEVSLNIKPY